MTKNDRGGKTVDKRRNSYAGNRRYSNDDRMYNSSYEESTRGNLAYEYDYSEHEYQRYVKRKDRIDRLHDKRVKAQARQERADAARLRRLENSRGVNMISCIIFCICAIAIYNLASSYLKVNSSITATQKEIAQVESDYDTLKAKNDSSLEEINSSIDLKSIYDIAVNELGMVFATDNQIIKYEDNEAAYVRDYEDIPDTQPNNPVEDIVDSIK